jgi:hypothetical protein
VGAAAAGVVAIGVGIGFQLASSSHADDAQGLRDGLPAPQASACTVATGATSASCAQLRSAVDDQHSDANLRTGFWVAGGLLLAGGAVAFLLSPPSTASAPSAPSTGGAKQPARPVARLVPVLSPTPTGAHGLAVVGRF